MPYRSGGLASAEFRAQLRRYRERRRWSQERLADECELDHSLVSRLEAGSRSPTRESLGKVCAGLGLVGAEADDLWLAAGFLPPCLDAAALTAALDLVRHASAAEIAAAGRLIRVARAG